MYDRGPYDGSPIAGPNPHHPLNSGLRGWWLAAPGYSGGTQWWDVLGRLNGTLTNFTARAWHGSPQRWGRLLLDGVDDLVTLPNTAGVIATKVFTWSAWIATTSATANATVISEGLVANGTPLWQLNLDQVTGTHAGIAWRDDLNVAYVLTGTVVVTDGGWHHVVATGDGSTASLYVDGAFDNSMSIAATSSTTLDRCSLGCLGRPANNNFWAGSLDDVRSWPRALSAAEVNALYRESLAGYPEALLYWRPTPAAFAPVGDPVFPWPMTMSVP